MAKTIELKLKAGDVAPKFTVATNGGGKISLADYKGRNVILYFYPKDNTPGCTKEACAFRDAYEDFVRAGAVVIGVSSDSPERHQAFASGHRLPFLLLADQGGSLRQAFGVPKSLGLFPGRVTYIIDTAGIVRHVFNSQFSADRHVTEALEIVRKLAQDNGGTQGRP